MSELPRIKRGDKTYYFDARLQQLRNVENPHDFIDLSPLETEEIKQKLQSPTKTCERCHGAIKKGEKCSETDVGSGKFVHWPNCPSRVEMQPVWPPQPETSGQTRLSAAKLDVDTINIESEFGSAFEKTYQGPYQVNFTFKPANIQLAILKRAGPHAKHIPRPYRVWLLKGLDQIRIDVDTVEEAINRIKAIDIAKEFPEPGRKKWSIEEYRVFQTLNPTHPYSFQYRIQGKWDLKDFNNYDEMHDFMLKGEAELPVHYTEMTEIVAWPAVDVPVPVLKPGTQWEQKDLGYTYALEQATFMSDWGAGHWPLWVWKIGTYDTAKQKSEQISVSEHDLIRGQYGFPKETIPGPDINRFYEWFGKLQKSASSSSPHHSNSGEEAKLWRLWFTTPQGFEAFFWSEAKTQPEAETEAKKYMPEGSFLRYADLYDENGVKELLRGFTPSELEAVARGTPAAFEAYLHVFHTEKVPVAVQRVAEKILKGEDPPPGAVFLVDGLTLKDYYDMRDLRLLLWGLEKELIGKYGITEAEPLASKVRDVIKEKITELTNKIGASPEHSPEHFFPTVGGLDKWLKKHNLTLEGFQALPNSAKSLIYEHYKHTMDDPPDDPSVSPGKFTVRFNEGLPTQEDIELEATSREAATIEAARTYSIEHSGAYPSTAKIIAPMAPSLAMEAWQRRALGEERPPF